MSDPIRELENFGAARTPVNPPPPQEIRRRGDRRRSRQHALTAFATAAAVAVVSTTGAAVGGAFDRAAGPDPFDAPTVAPAPTAPSTPPSSSSPQPSPGAPAVEDTDDIPGGFPLDVDHLDLTGDGGRVLGPGFGAPGVDLDLCGAALWTVTARDRLGFSSTGPEYADVRELRTFESADDAVAQMSAIRSLLTGCEPEPTDGGGERVWTTYDVDTGYETIAFGSSYTLGLGGEVHHAVRVGRAILVLGRGGEFSAESAEAFTPEQTTLARSILPAMCVFTEAGCGDPESVP